MLRNLIALIALPAAAAPARPAYEKRTPGSDR